jgi:hypothetical protein
MAPAATDKSEDPYEFKTSSCDEPATLALSGEKCKEPLQLQKDEKKAAEKRAINNGEEVDDDGKKKKKKEEKESKSGRGAKANLTGKLLSRVDEINAHLVTR